MNFAGSSGGGAAVNFLTVGSKSHASEAVEPKICEWCGAGFWRKVPELAKLGQKVCPGCQARFDELRAAEELRATVAQQLGRRTGRRIA